MSIEVIDSDEVPVPPASELGTARRLREREKKNGQRSLNHCRSFVRCASLDPQLFSLTTPAADDEITDYIGRTAYVVPWRLTRLPDRTCPPTIADRMYRPRTIFLDRKPVQCTPSFIASQM